MKDWINKFFANLAKVDALTYLLVGGFCSAFIYTLLLDAKTSLEFLRPIGYAVFIVMMSNGYITRRFYEKFELGRKYLPKTNSGIVKKDTFFYTKINSNITSTKKLAGYIYVIFRVWTLIGLGFILFFLPLYWINFS